ncbi:threonine--tRNA ligase [Natranaerobius thermophilus]|uniref:Threonine--tRNA ligase n=1 Tax=Natranaerobius thermophilus (strain ATCC BAA-1301 / DSM 18059 / JW/NM-WN-LF) TaxID=457570 RepID=SYT_NATTJ|nr:threonine--tRNA ligase [Natranaerobius thermophilus]B2A5P2.1 RecName: Full=Threonine--tRNA ligase; AltName: Full=Threonyl-tRNA synthetase; Short=ThrRS [Natranaerobius thermophilus JW/NM-WN-LF]ACB85396.1 Ser-tRNA(Thr) hydrolase, threonyl-tRNA synthetase [Natranaerobius thermophilus JW/NM-WN-LF]
MLKITLKDGSVKEIEKGSNVLDLAKSISNRLAKEAVGAKVDGKTVGLNKELNENCEVEILSFEDDEGCDIYRHTSSHILAHAVKRLYDNVKLGIGPPIKDGFYYDFDLEHSLSDKDLEDIKKEMKKIIKEDLPIERKVYKRDEAIEMFKEMGEDYKIELIQDLGEDEEICCYQQGDFIDLCQGPHLPSTGKIKDTALDLLKVAGAYWRGDENRAMLQRIYGTSFIKKSQLEEYIQRLEEAKKREHRKLGKELDLFSFHEEAPGSPFFHNNGMIVINELIDFWRREHRKAGYQEISTPIILNRGLWERSGHWDHFQENMYFTEIDDEDFAVKPMNCPGAMLVYNNNMYSYRDFPLRVAELGKVHRHELSGALHGLLRARSFTQDDAHIFMLPSQVEEELENVINLVDRFYSVFGFNYYVELSTKPEKAMGSDEIWDRAINALKSVLEKRGIKYIVNEGDGAFYGPKIDFQLEDAIGRSWQCSTIQLDFLLPERFDLTYIGEDGQKHRPVMIHRVIYGAIERFFALLIEHYEGKFPLWLAPRQAVIIPIADRHMEYGKDITKQLESEGIRADLDQRNEKIGYKIRDAQLKKVPYMLIVGDDEVENKTVSVRTREDGDIGSKSVAELVDEIKVEIDDMD